MAKNETEKNITVDDVVAQAEGFLAKEKTVPAQAAPKTEEKTGDDVQPDENCDETDNSKKSFGERLKPLGEKIKKNRKGIILTLAVVGAATVAVAKFAAKTVVEEAVDAQKLSEMTDEELSKVEGIEDVAEAKNNA